MIQRLVNDNKIDSTLYAKILFWWLCLNYLNYIEMSMLIHVLCLKNNMSTHTTPHIHIKSTKLMTIKGMMKKKEKIEKWKKIQLCQCFSLRTSGNFPIFIKKSFNKAYRMTNQTLLHDCYHDEKRWGRRNEIFLLPSCACIIYNHTWRFVYVCNIKKSVGEVRDVLSFEWNFVNAFWILFSFFFIFAKFLDQFWSVFIISA